MPPRYLVCVCACHYWRLFKNIQEISRVCLLGFVDVVRSYPVSICCRSDHFHALYSAALPGQVHSDSDQGGGGKF